MFCPMPLTLLVAMFLSTNFAGCGVSALCLALFGSHAATSSQSSLNYEPGTCLNISETTAIPMKHLIIIRYWVPHHSLGPQHSRL